MIVACRSAWSAGRATLTTVPSMNVMLDPRIVATSVHRRADHSGGDAAAEPNGRVPGA